MIPQDIAKGIAEGDLDPITKMQLMVSFLHLFIILPSVLIGKLASNSFFGITVLRYIWDGGINKRYYKVVKKTTHCDSNLT